MRIIQLAFLFAIIATSLTKAQIKDNLTFILKEKIPFYYTERHIQYDNIDYTYSDTEVLIYKVNYKYFNAIRLRDFETMIIEKKYLNFDELVIQEINSFNLSKEDAINLAKDIKETALQKKIEDKKLLDVSYKKIGLVFINSNFTNKKVINPDELIKILYSNDSSIDIDETLFKKTNYKGLGIKIKNAYDKDIKYIRFNLVPYNRVEDIISNTLISTKKIEIIGPFKSNLEDYFIFNEIWLDENNIVDYIKITDINVTFMDNKVITIKNPDTHFISKTNRVNSK